LNQRIREVEVGDEAGDEVVVVKSGGHDFLEQGHALLARKKSGVIHVTLMC